MLLVFDPEMLWFAVSTCAVYHRATYPASLNNSSLSGAGTFMNEVLTLYNMK